MKKLGKMVKTLLIPVIITLTLIILFRCVLILGYVQTASMEPTLKSGSVITGFRLYGQLKKGDIIIFRHEDSLLVKRIAAVEGENIERNGEILTVPDGCYYVIGDHAEDSFDSRYWENPFLPEENILARVNCRE